MYKKFLVLFLAFILLIFVGYAFSGEEITTQDRIEEMRHLITPILDDTLEMGMTTDLELEALGEQLEAIENIETIIDQLTVKLNLKLDAINAHQTYNNYNSVTIAKSEQLMEDLMEDVKYNQAVQAVN